MIIDIYNICVLIQLRWFVTNHTVWLFKICAQVKIDKLCVRKIMCISMILTFTYHIYI